MSHEEVFVTREQARRVDRLAMEQFGVPGIMLMENAGRHCAAVAAEMLGDVRDRDVTILCGGGNNGGDGFVIARHLTNWGANVRVSLLCAADKVLSRDDETAVNLNILLKSGVPVHEAVLRKEVEDVLDVGLVVDALLGTGLTGEVRPPYRSAILAINEASARVLAVDVPSGLDCNTGQPLGVAVRAARTVTFVFNKVGFALPGADAYTGQVQVVDIGVPRAALDRLRAAWQSEAR